MKRTLLVMVLALLLSLTTGFAFANDEQKPIYGSQLMTQDELTEYRARTGSATTAEEREQIRNEHQARMKERARARGMELPDEPPRPGAAIESGGRGSDPPGAWGPPGGQYR